VTFDVWQYGGNPNYGPPADGVSFFLTDGEADLTHPGAFGGSLGYAKKQPTPNIYPTPPFIDGVAHGYLGVGLDVLGNYFADTETLDKLEGEGRVVFRYCDEAGEASAQANPNGAQRNIAGICSETGRVVGLMPHPERLFELALGGADGRRMIESALLSALEAA